MKSKKWILFYLQQDYYLPSLMPVYDEFRKEPDKYDLFFGVGKNQIRYFKIILISQRRKIENKLFKDGFKVTRNFDDFDVVIAGSQLSNSKRFGNALLVNLDHGPGIKTLRYRHLLKQKHTKYLCLIEGNYRLEKFRKYGLDKIHKVEITGLPKLDAFFDGTYNKDTLRQKYNLDTTKKTILYAPSFKPTSIFSIGKKILQLSDKFNVIVKLHPFSWSGKYAPHEQHLVFERKLKQYPNLKLIKPEEHNILPFMFVADTMVSDGSSTINEFLALNRCGIIVDLPEKTHHDGVPLLENQSSEWLKNSFVHISEDSDLETAIEQALNPLPERIKNLQKDRNYIFSYSDGKSALRVKKVIESIIHNIN